MRALEKRYRELAGTTLEVVVGDISSLRSVSTTPSLPDSLAWWTEWCTQRRS